MSSVILLTTGVPGCGKSYVRCARFLVDDYLINTTRGKHISNFPVNIDVIAEDVSNKLNSRVGRWFGLNKKIFEPEQIKSRIVKLDDDIMSSWRSEASGPWETFADLDLKYCHIAIDEIHNYVSTTSSSEYIKQWDEWLGEIRHRGCTFEGITQDIAKVNRVFLGRAAIRLELIPCEDLRDPFFKIPMMDWYELKASLTGFFHKTVVVFEKRKHLSSWKTNHVHRFCISPDYFKYYNSYNASQADIDSGYQRDEQSIEYQYQQRTKLSLIFWFLGRNWFNLLWRFALIFLLLWLCFFGGLNFFISRWLDISKSMYKKNTSSSSQSVKKTVSPVPGRSSSVITSKDSYVQKKHGFRDKSDYELSRRIHDELHSPYKPCIFFDSQVWLKNGIRINEGYIFKGGVYDGKKVFKINFKERFYSLDDGTIIGMYDQLQPVQRN